MAASTQQISLAKSTSWTKITDGPFNAVLKIEEETPDVEYFYRATASAPTASDGGFPLRWWDGTLSIVVKTGDSLWVRSQVKATTVFAMLQDG